MHACKFPCSFAQQRLWFLDRLTPGSSVYNIPAAVRLGHPLDAACLERSVNELVSRHETLRTTFREVNGEPVQVISERQRLEVAVTDLRLVGPERREAEAERLATEEARCPFDLQSGPLLRVGLLLLSEREQVLLVTMHHIISDGWSVEVFFRELAALYEAFSNGEPPRLPDLPIQYADYAVWQREWLQGDVLNAQLGYWRNRLAGVPALQIPTDYARPSVFTHKGAREFLRLNENTTAALRELSQRESATLFMTVLAAFKALLYRYTGQEDIAVGTVLAGRNRAELEPLIGFFVNTLVLRTDLAGGPSFRELLARVKDAAVAAYAHQDLPFERLVEELQPARDLGRNPLVQVTFQLFSPPKFGDDLKPGASSEGEATDRLLEIAKGTAKFDLSLEMWESGSVLEGRMEYSTDLFEAATVRRMLEHFVRLADAAAKQPDQPIATLPLMSAAERELQLAAWNDTTTVRPFDKCVHELFEERVRHQPGAEALVWGDEVWTYEQLDRRANGIAERLRALGIGPETTVGVCLSRTPLLVAALLGVLKAGGAYVPLDPTYPAGRLEFMLDDARCAAVLSDGSIRPALSRTGAPVVNVRQIADGEPCNQSGAEPSSLAYVLYTSGSTGQPKGVAIEHRNTAALVGWAGEFYGPEDLTGVLASTSVCFDLSVFELFVPLCCGGTVILIGSALELPRAPARNRVTLINTVPSAIAELASARSIPDSVRTVNLAGEPLRSALVEEVFQASSAECILNLYGPTEDTTYSTCAVIKRGTSWRPTIGRPIANRRAYVLDRNMMPLPPGITGELYLGGAGVARGYLNRPELTAERFLRSPFVAGTRLYRTGDLARYRENGEIEFLGRSDHQVKLRGYRIELGEIEAALLAHPRIRGAAVVMRENGRSGPIIAAYAAPRPGTAVEESEIVRHLERRLPPFMVPHAVTLMDSLPMTANGKLDRVALRAAQPQVMPSDRPRVAPRTELERSITAIWKEVLGLNDVSVHDNFFELGGHSLLLLRLQARLAAAGWDVAVVDLFRYPTVKSLAMYVADPNRTASSTVDNARQRAGKQNARAKERERVHRATGGAPWTGNA